MATYQISKRELGKAIQPFGQMINRKASWNASNQAVRLTLGRDEFSVWGYSYKVGSDDRSSARNMHFETRGNCRGPVTSEEPVTLSVYYSDLNDAVKSANASTPIILETADNGLIVSVGPVKSVAVAVKDDRTPMDVDNVRMVSEWSFDEFRRVMEPAANVAKDSDGRPALMGVHLRAQNGRMNIEATEGFRLVTGWLPTLPSAETDTLIDGEQLGHFIGYATRAKATVVRLEIAERLHHVYRLTAMIDRLIVGQMTGRMDNFNYPDTSTISGMWTKAETTHTFAELPADDILMVAKQAAKADRMTFGEPSDGRIALQARGNGQDVEASVAYQTTREFRTYGVNLNPKFVRQQADIAKEAGRNLISMGVMTQNDPVLFDAGRVKTIVMPMWIK